MGDANIELATASALITGHCAVLEHSGRLVDVLRSVTLLVLSECCVRPVQQPSEAVAVGATCYVPAGHVVWARPLEGAGGAGYQRSDDDRVVKIAHPLVVVAEPFTIRGKIHLVEGADPTLALEKLAQGFLPVTDARVACDGASWEAPFVALNGRLVELFSLEPAGASPAGVQNAAAVT